MIKTGDLIEENILDSSLDEGRSKLSDYQLVGILLENVKYPIPIKERVETELNKRNLSSSEKERLKEKYLKPIITTEGSIINYGEILLLFLVLLFGFFITNAITILVGMTVIIASLFAVIRRFRIGKRGELMIWAVVQIGYFFLFLAALIIGLVI